MSGQQIIFFPFILTLQGAEAAYFQTPSLYTNITSVTVNELISTCGVFNSVPPPKRKYNHRLVYFPTMHKQLVQSFLHFYTNDLHHPKK